jgi:hypothetical protein
MESTGHNKSHDVDLGLQINDGSKDVGDQPNKLLLAIGLDPLTSEETVNLRWMV